MKGKTKVRFSTIGGICLTQQIPTHFHQHHAITLVISDGMPFTLQFQRSVPQQFLAVVIQPEVSFRTISSGSSYLLFAHLDPYSVNGINLRAPHHPVISLPYIKFFPILNEIIRWNTSAKDAEKNVTGWIDKLSYGALKSARPSYVSLDERVLASIDFLKDHPTKKVRIEEAADWIHLSPSRLAHLIQQETGTTYRKLIRHFKLIDALQSMCRQNALGWASADGNFADQAHFTRTFKDAFGIAPSKIMKG